MPTANTIFKKISGRSALEERPIKNFLNIILQSLLQNSSILIGSILSNAKKSKRLVKILAALLSLFALLSSAVFRLAENSQKECLRHQFLFNLCSAAGFLLLGRLDRMQTFCKNSTLNLIFPRLQAVLILGWSNCCLTCNVSVFKEWLPRINQCNSIFYKLCPQARLKPMHNFSNEQNG